MNKKTPFFSDYLLIESTASDFVEEYLELDDFSIAEKIIEDEAPETAEASAVFVYIIYMLSLKLKNYDFDKLLNYVEKRYEKEKEKEKNVTKTYVEIESIVVNFFFDLFDKKYETNIKEKLYEFMSNDYLIDNEKEYYTFYIGYEALSYTAGKNLKIEYQKRLEQIDKNSLLINTREDYEKIIRPLMAEYIYYIEPELIEENKDEIIEREQKNYGLEASNYAYGRGLIFQDGSVLIIPSDHRIIPEEKWVKMRLAAYDVSEKVLTLRIHVNISNAMRNVIETMLKDYEPEECYVDIYKSNNRLERATPHGGIPYYKVMNFIDGYDEDEEDDYDEESIDESVNEISKNSLINELLIKFKIRNVYLDVPKIETAKMKIIYENSNPKISFLKIDGRNEVLSNKIKNILNKQGER